MTKLNSKTDLTNINVIAVDHNVAMLNLPLSNSDFGGLLVSVSGSTNITISPNSIIISDEDPTAEETVIATKSDNQDDLIVSKSYFKQVVKVLSQFKVKTKLH